MKNFLIFLAVVIGLVVVFKGRIEKAQAAHADPYGAGLCGTRESYAEQCMKNDLALDFAGGRDRVSAGSIYLRGSMTNRGGKRLSDVTVRIKGTDSTGSAKASFAHHLGPFAPNQTRTFEEIVQTLWGQETSGGREVVFDYKYAISVESVRFSG